MSRLPGMLALLLLLASPATAEEVSREASRLAVAYFDAPSRGVRAEALREIRRAARGDNGARFLLGAAEFFAAVEGLAQDLNRHGFVAQALSLRVGPNLPVPPQPNPQPLDYDGFRRILERFHDRLDGARKTLSEVDPKVPFKLEIGLSQTRLAMAPGDAISGDTTIARLIATGRIPGVRLPGGATDLVFRYDNADALWLEGYANLVLAQTSFTLAHDFRRLFDTTFHAVFPRAGLPLADRLVPPRDAPARAFIDWRLFDFVAFIHLIDFEVVAPKRRRAAREHLLAMIDLSRRTWTAIEAETDADHEWLPGPQQAGGHPMPGVAVSKEEVAAWLRMLDLFEEVLEGKKLVPHPRFSPQAMMGMAARSAGPARGIDLKRFFERPARFDLVLFITGSGALPYLRQGELADPTEWRRAMRAFGRRGLLGTAIWFN